MMVMVVIHTCQVRTLVLLLLRSLASLQKFPKRGSCSFHLFVCVLCDVSQSTVSSSAVSSRTLFGQRVGVNNV